MTFSEPEITQGAHTLSTAARLVAEARADFHALSSTLSGRLSGMHGSWSGQGAQAFFVLHQSWTERQRRIVDALDDFEAALIATETDNLRTDDHQSAAFAAFTRALG